jgi:hypothetical protein
MEKNELAGLVHGTDPNFTLTTHTGQSKKNAKHTDPLPRMKLTTEEQEIYDGKKGPLLQKAIKTIIDYGQMFGAEKLVDLGGAPHMAMSWGSDAVEPFLKIYKQFADEGLKTYKPFTADPMPMDNENLNPGPEKHAMVEKIYDRQDELQQVNLKLGLKDKDSWSCVSYVKEMGNRPDYGDYLAWSESSAINFVNSVLGARTNRNSMGIDMMCNILGKAPLFGLLTDEGRKATWLIEVKTKKRPHPMLLGSAIGFKVMEDVSYIAGMKDFIGEINDKTIGYLKDMGATTASNGAVGLYHMEGITPEAIKKGRDLLKEDYKTYVIDDEELERIHSTYPDLWKDPNHNPEHVFIGCPHNTVEQLREWAERMETGLDKAGKTKVACPTALFASKKVKNAFVEKYPEQAKSLTDNGAVIAFNCPMMYLSTPLEADELIATNSNKCRVYTTARFFFDDELIHIMITGKLPPSYIQRITKPTNTQGGT